MGYHRDTFYEVRRAFQVGGVRPTPAFPYFSTALTAPRSQVMQYATVGKKSTQKNKAHEVLSSTISRNID
jgi:hypothetical protein